jgi:hypothetical protein
LKCICTLIDLRDNPWILYEFANGFLCSLFLQDTSRILEFKGRALLNFIKFTSASESEFNPSIMHVAAGEMFGAKINIFVWQIQNISPHSCLIIFKVHNGRKKYFIFKLKVVNQAKNIIFPLTFIQGSAKQHA